jgi:transcriptional regulator with XRE-family HTH domain
MGNTNKTGGALTAWVDGNCLINLRGERKQYLVAADCRISSTRLSQYEKYKASAPIGDILKLAQYYGVSARSLLMPKSIQTLSALQDNIRLVLSDDAPNGSIARLAPVIGGESSSPAVV